MLGSGQQPKLSQSIISVGCCAVFGDRMGLRPPGHPHLLLLLHLPCLRCGQASHDRS
jgi:hypothetical protein